MAKLNGENYSSKMKTFTPEPAPPYTPEGTVQVGSITLSSLEALEAYQDYCKNHWDKVYIKTKDGWKRLSD